MDSLALYTATLALDDYAEYLENENYHTIDLITFSPSFAKKLGDAEHAFSNITCLINPQQIEDFHAYEKIQV